MTAVAEKRWQAAFKGEKAPTLSQCEREKGRERRGLTLWFRRRLISPETPVDEVEGAARWLAGWWWCDSWLPAEQGSLGPLERL